MVDGASTSEALRTQFCELADEHLRLLQHWQRLREDLEKQDRPFDKNEFARVTQKLRESQAAMQEFTWRFGGGTKR